MRYTTLLSRRLTPDIARHVALVAPIVFALTSSLALADPPEPSGPPVAPLSPELQAALHDMLSYDPLHVPVKRPTSPLRKPAQDNHELDWNRTDKQDGTSSVTVKKPLATPWDAKVGADFGLAALPATTFQPSNPYPYKDNGSGTAWATVTVPGVASVDTRVDPMKDQRKLGTTFSRSMPIGSNYSVVLQDSYVVTETLGSAPAAVPGTSATQTPAQVWSNDKLVKFNVLSTGTSLAAGTTSSTIDNITRNKFSAEQKLFESFNVTTAMTDVGSGRPVNKSITAGFKLKW